MKYTALDTLLILALMERFHRGDKKHLKKLTLKLTKKVVPSVQDGLLNDVLNQGFSEALDRHVEHYTLLEQVSEQITRLGGVGVLIHEGQAYPVVIHLETNEDRDWTFANEADIALACGNDALISMGLSRIDCRVVLFHHAGFSGVTHRFELEPGVARKFERRVGSPVLPRLSA